MTALSRATRRTLIGGGATVAIASLVHRGHPVASAQRNRRLLDQLALLEQIQISWYRSILEAFDADDFATAGTPPGLPELLQEILASEEAHLAALIDFGADPPPAISTSIGTDLTEALRQAAMIENLVAAAYAGTIPDVRPRRVRQDIIGLHGVEARQAAIMGWLAGEDPFPKVVDDALSPQEALTSILAIGPNDKTGATPEAPMADITPLVEEIARTLSVGTDEIQVLSVEPRDWPNASLGCPEPGMVYAEVITPGYLLMVEVGTERFEFHTDTRGNVVRCP